MKRNGRLHYLWRAVDHEGEVLEAYVTRRRDREAALRFLRRTMKLYGNPLVVVTDRLPSYRAAMNVIGNAGRQAPTSKTGPHSSDSAATNPSQSAANPQDG